MVSMTIDMPEGALAAMRKDSVGFAHEMRLAAAVKWYELRRVSQGRAAEIAGLSRAEFIAELGRFGVTPFQASADEILEEAVRVPVEAEDVEAEQPPTVLERLKPFVGAAKGLPADLAKNHDHYIHGTPKKS